MASLSRARFVAYVVVDVLLLSAAVAGTMSFATPVIGLSWALALVGFEVLTAMIVGLLLYPHRSEVVKPLISASSPLAESTTPAPAKKAPIPAGSGCYYIERKGMLFTVEMNEREGPAKEPYPEIATVPLCPKDYVRMVQAGDDTDWSGTILRRNFRCPNGDSKGVIAYGDPEHTLEVIKALAIGRWHNGDQFDPVLRERSKPAARLPAKTFSEPIPRVAPSAVRIAPARKAVITPTSKPSQPEPERVEEQIPSQTIEVRTVASVRLPVKKGDQVYGHLREEEGQTFSWFIVDLVNLGLMERGETYDYEAGEEDTLSGTTKWTAPSDGPWFLAFDAYRKQNTRYVVVELWRRYLP